MRFGISSVRGMPWSRANVLLVALLLFAVGTAVGVVATPAPVPQPLRQPASGGMVPVTYERFDDARTVELEVRSGGKRQVLSPSAGVVTRFACEPGAQFSSGKSPISIDGEAKVALHTRVPLWRDIDPGSSGPDVKALQAELRRLGLTASNTGRYDRATRLAVSKLLGGHGVRPAGSRLSVKAFIWLPEERVKVESCEVDVGAAVSPRQPVATVPARVTSIQAKTMPQNLVDGKRVLVIDDVAVSTDSLGRVTDEADVARVMATPIAVIASSSNGSVPMTATLALAEPLRVAAVPPSALLTGGGGSNCIVDADGNHIEVSVVSSTLGRSLVTTAPGSPQLHSVRIDPAPSDSCA